MTYEENNLFAYAIDLENENISYGGEVTVSLAVSRYENRMPVEKVQ